MYNYFLNKKYIIFILLFIIIMLLLFNNSENFNMLKMQNRKRRDLNRSIQNREINKHVDIVTKQSIQNKELKQSKQIQEMQQSQLQNDLYSQQYIKLQTEFEDKVKTNPVLQSQPYLQSELKTQLQSQLYDTLQSQQHLQEWKQRRAIRQSQFQNDFQSQLVNGRFEGCSKILYENDGFVSSCTDKGNNYYDLTINNVDGVFNNVHCDSSGDVTIYYNGTQNTITECGNIHNPNIRPR